MVIKSDAVGERKGLGEESVKSELETDAVLAVSSILRGLLVILGVGGQFTNSGRGKDMETHDGGGGGGVTVADLPRIPFAPTAR